jgi:penicillin amidase
MAASALDRAASAAEFTEALARWKMPARVMTFESAGRRVSVGAGMVPVRHGWNGALPAPGWSGAEWNGWTTPDPARSRALSPQARASQLILDAVRLHPDRGEALLQQLTAHAASRDALAAQRAALVELLAQALHERELSGRDVIFAHPLAVTPAARQRFNVPARGRPGASTHATALIFDAADWDRSTAIAAPGQSGWADSTNFADLATLWSEGKFFPLAFSDSAVQAHAAATLTLTAR